MAGRKNDTQAKILEYIETSSQINGYPPSVREICEATGLKSTSTVHGHLVRLEKKGLLNRTSMRPRAITVPDDHKKYKMDMVEVPIVGKVTAGAPITAIENIEDYISLPKSMIGEGDHYVLSVCGESMIEAGIMDGDYVVVRKQSTAYNGEIVVNQRLEVEQPLDTTGAGDVFNGAFLYGITNGYTPFEALRLANKKGVQLLAYDCTAAPDSIEIDASVKINLNE